MSRNEPIVISEAEAIVMEVLWAKCPLAAEDICSGLEEKVEWQSATVKTLLNRLLKKGAIRAGKEGRRYMYSPVLSRDEWLLQESSGLLERLFGGRVAPLVAHFSQHRKLSAGDVRDLRKLLKEIGDGK